MSNDPEDYLVAPHGCFTLSVIYSQLYTVYIWNQKIYSPDIISSLQPTLTMVLSRTISLLFSCPPCLHSPAEVWSLRAQGGQHSDIATQRQSITQLHHSSQCCPQITFLLFRCSSPPPPQHICSVTVWLVFH